METDRPPDISLAPVPAAGRDALPGRMAEHARQMLSGRLTAYLREKSAPYRSQVALTREAIGQLPQEELATILGHPVFGKWVATEAGTADGSMLDLNRIVLASLIEKNAMPVQGLAVPLSYGLLRGPGLRPHRVSREPADQLAQVRLDGNQVELEAGCDRGTVAAADLLHGGIRPSPDLSVTLDAGDPSFTRFLDRMNAVSGAGTSARRDLEPVTDPSPDLIELYRDVLARLRACWPEAADELERYVHVIVPFRSRLLLGWATPLFQGAIFVRATPDDQLFTFERVVHEAAHLRLFAIQRTGKLLTDSPDKRLRSTVRTDPRPVIGVFHAAFVYARLSEAFARAVDHGAEGRWQSRLDELLENYRGLSRTLHAEATLTELGSQILSELDVRIETVFG